jgi:hypothetical protein
MTIENDGEREGKSSSPSDSSNCDPTDFEILWVVYPRKEGREEAWGAWQRAWPALWNGTPAFKRDGIVSDIHEAILQARKSDEWTRSDGRFVPRMAKFIEGRRWEDYPPKWECDCGRENDVTTVDCREGGAEWIPARMPTDEEADAADLWLALHRPGLQSSALAELPDAEFIPRARELLAAPPQIT